ncbi:MAG: hypothetical protein ACYC64_07975 [Armatimonadota bacterium]
MLTIEEYIARRKREDRLDEFDANLRIENMKMCTNYVFEYFGNYLNTTEAEERTALHDEKLDQYRKQLHEYSPEVGEWLVGIYADYGKRVNLTIGNFLKQIDVFFLYSSDGEFRSVSYDCYSQLIKKNIFLKEQTEMLFCFIKEYHQAQSQRRRQWDIPFISDEINEWIEETWAKYQVDLAGFSRSWVESFCFDEKAWPVTHRMKSRDPFFKYEYDFRQRSNLFNLDSLYRKMPKKPFTKGRKQEFEIVMMYYWLHAIVSDDDDYWQEYCKKTLPAVKPK